MVSAAEPRCQISRFSVVLREYCSVEVDNRSKWRKEAFGISFSSALREKEGDDVEAVVDEWIVKPLRGL